MKAAKKSRITGTCRKMRKPFTGLSMPVRMLYIWVAAVSGPELMRENFSEEELVACIRYAHLFQRKVYLTVNTLVKESEFSGLYEYVLPITRPDWMGVIVRTWECLHISENISQDGTPWKHSDDHYREYGAAFSEGTGGLSCSSRQRAEPCGDPQDQRKSQGLRSNALSMEPCVIAIPDSACSAVFWGASGNRGRCAQPCRLPYTTGKHPKECYPLSLKDMCTIEYIPELLEAGIDSFKIEGRMKKPEYAAGVTAIYRKYIDRYYADSKAPQKISAADMHTLSLPLYPQ